MRKRTAPKRRTFVADEVVGYFVFSSCAHWSGWISKIQAYIATTISSNQKREDEGQYNDCGQKRTAISGQEIIGFSSVQEVSSSSSSLLRLFPNFTF